jgi:hypothetical protein
MTSTGRENLILVLDQASQAIARADPPALSIIREVRRRRIVGHGLSRWRVETFSAAREFANDTRQSAALISD